MFYICGFIIFIKKNERFGLKRQILGQHNEKDIRHLKKHKPAKYTTDNVHL